MPTTARPPTRHHRNGYPLRTARAATLGASTLRLPRAGARALSDQVNFLDIVEEHDGNEALDVEAEATGSFPDIDKPWNPESIRVGTKSFSLRNMLDAIEENSLDLAPDFQRLHVWTKVQKAQLIESILLQIPLPAFYFAEDPDGTLRVVDGVQRLSTIDDFVRGGSDHAGGFALEGLEYIASVIGMRFGDLPPLWQRRIYNTQIVAHVIAPSTPSPVMYDIFRRINTGGTPLNAQEIRHCMSKPRSRNFLRTLTALSEFNVATNGLLAKQRRMIDREVALRFCAFFLSDPLSYNYRTIDEFLWDATEQIDDPSKISDHDLANIQSAFVRGLGFARAVFGAHAFRKWPVGDDRLRPINRALFESWTVELARIGEAPALSAGARIAASARQVMTVDPAYISSITASTGTPSRVHTRFRTAREIVEDATDA